jgi:hypothetical protein
MIKIKPRLCAGGQTETYSYLASRRLPQPQNVCLQIMGLKIFRNTVVVPKIPMSASLNSDALEGLTRVSSKYPLYFPSSANQH